MRSDTSLTQEIVAKAESLKEGICAGVVRLKDVLQGPSYQVVQDGAVRTTHFSDDLQVDWPADGLSFIVLGLRHPLSEPRLDWWERGDTLGNRHLRRASQTLKRWFKKEHGLDVVPLPYHVEKGGIFLKDAAALAGLGVMGRNNLLIHPQWGPRIRLRALLVKEVLAPTNALQGFAPCETCEGFCKKACPVVAFEQGCYHRPDCLEQMNQDEANRGADGDINVHGFRLMAVKYCRACELACPVGD